MKGPYPLSTDNVREKVDEETGVFLLRKSKQGPVRFVGKTKDLPRRLRDHADEYRYFEVEPKSDITEAYKREAALWHYHGGSDEKLDNPRHPPRPHRQIKCPMCDIHD